GLGRAIGSTSCGQSGAACGGIAVLDPEIEVSCREAANIGGKIRLRFDEPTEANEFIGSELVGIELRRSVALPFVIEEPEIRATGTLLSRTDSVTPIV